VGVMASEAVMVALVNETCPLPSVAVAVILQVAGAEGAV